MPLRHLVHSGHELTNAAQTLLTYSDNLVEGGAIFWHFTIANRSAVSRLVTVHFVPLGDSPTESNCVFDQYIPAHRTKVYGGVMHGNSGWFISAISDNANSDVGIRVTASEEYQS